MIRLLAGLCILIGALSAQARVFNLNNENFAAYVRGTYGPTFENTLNSQSSGNNVSLDSKHLYNLSGEFGFIYASPWVNVRFGLEVLKPRDIENETGRNASGTELYSMTSEVSVMIPKFALEMNVYHLDTARVYVSAGAGYANLAARNSYTMTSAGTSAFGMTEFYEDLRGGAMAFEGTVAYERLLTDSTTFVLEGGYRNMRFNDIKHNRDVTTISQGAVVKGDQAKTMDGSPRALNLSNWYAGLALRFWIK